MTTRYKVHATRAAAQAQADAIWEAYAADERARRGLRADQALDSRGGVPLPLSEAITVRYCEVVEAAGETRCAVPVDAYVETLNGRSVRGTVIDAASPVDEDALPQRLRDRVKADPANGAR